MICPNPKCESTGYMEKRRGRSALAEVFFAITLTVGFLWGVAAFSMDHLGIAFLIAFLWFLTLISNIIYICTRPARIYACPFCGAAVRA